MNLTHCAECLSVYAGTAWCHDRQTVPLPEPENESALCCEVEWEQETARLRSALVELVRLNPNGLGVAYARQVLLETAP